MDTWGRRLRNHPQFGPRGVNVNFVQVLREGELAVRTFEFGVEKETLSCGTGSATAAVLAARRFNWSEKFASGTEPVLVNSQGGDVLRIYFSLNDAGGVDDICLETIVRFIYRGTLHEDMLRSAADHSHHVASGIDANSVVRQR